LVEAEVRGGSWALKTADASQRGWFRNVGCGFELEPRHSFASVTSLGLRRGVSWASRVDRRRPPRFRGVVVRLIVAPQQYSDQVVGLQARLLSRRDKQPTHQNRERSGPRSCMCCWWKYHVGGGAQACRCHGKDDACHGDHRDGKLDERLHTLIHLRMYAYV